VLVISLFKLCYKVRVQFPPTLFNFFIPQIANLDENARFQSVINTIYAQRQIAALNLTFCGRDYLDIQDHLSYSANMNK
jgi:hypothetical protein